MDSTRQMLAFATEKYYDNQLFRSTKFFTNFLKWKLGQSFFQFEYCLSLNFDYFDINLAIQQIVMTPESYMKLTFDFPASCFMVMVGGKYLNNLNYVLKIVDSIANEIGRRPLAVFLIRNNYKEKDIVIDVNNENQRSTLVMVKKRDSMDHEYHGSQTNFNQ